MTTAHTLAAAAFDVCGPLPPEGATTVLEASAGTGKTFTIAALAARYIAEGRATLPQLMLVTFGREATQELRERVRDRLVVGQRALADPVAARAGDDGLLALLAGGDGACDAEVAARGRRLTQALTQFDAATIATTHQFCQQMLAGLGVVGDGDPDAVFVETVDDLVTEVVDDFYVRKYAAPGAGNPPFDRAKALELARRAVDDAQARLEPADAPADSAAGVRYQFACAVRREVGRRKRARRLFSYDDMLTRLAEALTDPARGPAARSRLRERYSVVLVDEFQDTDPVQWEILRGAFHGHTTLVLIGDPKQAIYAFRGADVVSYLEAADEASATATLARNWRSDAALLTALDTLFGGAALGDDRIVVHPPEAEHIERRLTRAPAGAPLRLRIVGRDRLPVLTGRGLGMVGPARQVVAADVAADIATLLAGPAQVQGRPVAPGDVAVLVRTNAHGGLIREALAAAGVPAVLTGTASVFATPIATEWLTLLEAIEQPQRTTRLRAAALTCFVGHTVAELCGPGGETIVEELGGLLRSWSTILREHGVAALLEAVSTGRRLAQRLLGRTDGERRLTDLRHIAQVLHRAATEQHLGPAALAEWLRHRIDDAATDTGAERSRRLESDADAVQIVTVHRSKGLEFPIVYLPFGWDRFVAREPDVLLLHERGRVLDVGGPNGPRYRDRLAAHRAEEAGEDLRLLYVGMTRARCQVVAWWAPATTTASSALHRLLVGRPAAGTMPAQSYPVPDDAAMLAQLRALASVDLVVEEVGEPADRRWRPPRRPTAELAAALFDRGLDTAWRRTSYSALTAAAHDRTPTEVASEPEDSGISDEPTEQLELDVAVGAGADPAVANVPSPMAELPVGTGFGTLVHAVLETADPTASGLLGELTEGARAELERRPSALDPADLAAALVPVVQTPLGPLTGGRALHAIPPADRLTELEFELPLAGGDAPGAALTLGDLAALLRAHLPADDPLRRYPDLLDTAALGGQPLRGYLTGSIDAVLRVDGRFLVVDYKTNWLGPVGPAGREPLTAAHYAPPLLAEAMLAAHYPLQALLYSVALHRYLRWRLAGYAPHRHLGGALYLFLRGMCGPATPIVGGTPCGVFGWAPPPELIVELSRLLDEGRAS
ncbi:UvrD-helicase domain-containing protein [Pseudonocardia asaccharolytica]|uniref:RecBCD enzyme subunit RecB n=1 Tax=Pseudonocardia asaccharolytica DSM 44247 = NBRC 16224 TaxID=1123024 RepID=A0A511D3S1_9PSEU|nr:UvrD-helicase domain-containing protein [Pseudonocardia asaccharolytica]GEL17558.1 RecBCD enzyme subunit RecB [Pseudonocardia asaccharolytica DSM 44247 = NBRC 16224]